MRYFYDPIGNNTPFVEIYNRSNKILDLKYCVLANRDSLYELANKKSIAPGGFPIFPEEYIVLSKNKNKFYRNIILQTLKILLI